MQPLARSFVLGLAVGASAPLMGQWLAPCTPDPYVSIQDRSPVR